MDSGKTDITGTYAHDGAGRLRSSTSDSTSVEDLLYEYDRSGNMTKKTVSPDPVDPQKDQVTDYYYDADNRLTGDSEGTAYSYDRCGNLTQKGFMTYDYDSLDRMTLAVSVPNYFSFTYDPLSRMTLKTDNSGAEQYTWMLGTKDDPVRITGYSDDPQSFIRTPDSKRVLALYEDGILNSYGLNAHTDVSFAADRTGGITWSSLYRPFGEARYGTGSLLNPLGFQSDYTDFDTGLVDMGSRWYAPELSRFTTEDTAEPKTTDPESYNPYLYADDAPLARIDPLGESWWNPWDWAKAAGRGVRKAGRGFFNFVIMPYFRSVSNAVNWVARTTSSLARGLGRGTMATLRGLKKAAITTGRGIRGGWRGFTNVVTGGAGWSNFGKEILKNYYDPRALVRNYKEGMQRLPSWARKLDKWTIIIGGSALAAIGGGYAVGGLMGLGGGGAATTAATATASGGLLASEAGFALTGFSMTLSAGLTAGLGTLATAVPVMDALLSNPVTTQLATEVGPEYVEMAGRRQEGLSKRGTTFEDHSKDFEPGMRPGNHGPNWVKWAIGFTASYVTARVLAEMYENWQKMSQLQRQLNDEGPQYKQR